DAVIEVTVDADVRREPDGDERARVGLQPDLDLRPGRQRVRRERAGVLVPVQLAKQRAAAHAEAKRVQAAGRSLAFRGLRLCGLLRRRLLDRRLLAFTLGGRRRLRGGLLL